MNCSALAHNEKLYLEPFVLPDNTRTVKPLEKTLTHTILVVGEHILVPLVLTGNTRIVKPVLKETLTHAIFVTGEHIMWRLL